MFLVLRSNPGHVLGGCVALLNHLGHSREGWTGMHEKELQSRTEVILARLAVAREREAILRTSTVAQVPDLAFLTLGGKRIALNYLQICADRAKPRAPACVFDGCFPV